MANKSKPITNKNPVIDLVFIGSPNLGILEQWLPVLFELKERNKNLKVYALFPKERVVDQAKPGDMLSELGEEIFDGAIFKTWFGAWLISDSLFGANLLKKQYEMPVFMRRALNLLKRYPMINYLAVVTEKILSITSRLIYYKTYNPDLKKLLKKTKAVCYDVYEEKKDYFSESKEALKNASFFSLMHGISLEMTEDKNESVANEIIKKTNKNVIAYVYSPGEISKYIRLYSLTENNIKPVGIPRHSRQWFDKIIKDSNKPVLPEGNYIFLVSRPANKAYFPGNPLNSKKQILKEIKALAKDLGLKIIVRLHPKESDESLYEKVFGEDDYGKSWEYSLGHPFALGANSTFCITFFSGVAIDMVALGVPVIERCSYCELKEPFNNIITKNYDGTPTSLFNKLGLVLGAANYDELRIHAHTILKDRNSIIQRQKDNYDKIFKSPEGSIDYIVKDVEKALDSRKVL